MVWTGAFMFKPCDCEIAKENERQSMAKLKKLHEEVKANLERMNNGQARKVSSHIS